MTKTSILVIDDELGIREGCRRALVPQGFVVETAGSIKEGLYKIQDFDFDLVLLDVMMPDGRGIDLLEPISQKDPDTVCVIITGYATVELAVQAIKQGAYDFISKPFTSDLLLMTVNQGLEKRKLSLESRRLQSIEREAEELARAKEEMERLDRYKSEFTLTVSHELRSPVAGAQSLLRTMIKGLAGDLNDQQRDILRRIEARLDMLMELIDDLLSLAASKAIEPDAPLEPVDLLTVIRRIVDHFLPEAQAKDILLLNDLPGDEIQVQATEDGLVTIFTNLVGNAIKYTPKGGSVRVGVDKSEGKIFVSVADTGIGIPEQDIPQLWQEFFRASNAKRSGITGTGLGLNIVKQYVDRFGGDVDVESCEGQGTTFKIVLPCQNK